MKEPKFKVGDVLAPVMEETDLIKMHVIEVITQTCPANIEQIKYICRVHVKPFKGSTQPAAILKNLFDFNEIEVELWKEKPK